MHKIPSPHARLAAAHQNLSNILTNNFGISLADPPTAKYIVHQPNDLLSSGEAGSYLKISPKTLANWRTAGSGPTFVRVGGAVRYRFSSLQDFVMRGLRTSTSDVGATHEKEM
jgi:hypothetical protein